MPERKKACCVIVGAGAGLGIHMARRFGQGGFDVALVSRTRDTLDRLVDRLTSEGYCAKGFAADAAVEESLGSAFDKIKHWNGNIGVVIYNAAAMMSDHVLDMTPAHMADQMALNLGGAICSVNHVLPAMRRRGSGTILMTGGGLGLEPYPNWASLSAGKAALRSYAIALHKALALEDIHVAVVAVCGIVEAKGPFAPDRIAQEYWRLHNEPKPNWRRELVYLPQGADPYYNDADGVYRSTSLPIV